MFLTVQKLQSRVKELATYRYRDAQVVESWRFRDDVAGEVGAGPVSMEDGLVVKLGDQWQGRDRYAWLGAMVQVPKAWLGKRVVGRFDFGRTGGGNNSGFESLLYLDGEPYQGVDGNHQEVFFPNDRIGQIVSLQFRLWAGLEGGGKHKIQEYRFTTGEIAWLDEATDDLYYTAVAALQTVHYVDENDANGIALLSALNLAFGLLDWSDPGSESFYASVVKARESLESFLQDREKNHDVTAYCVGHTHIDVAWLWQLRHTREKAARSFSTVLRLMEQFPEYIFLQTQPQLYDYLKRDYPAIYAQVKSKIEEGRWEAGGAMWLEADCNLTAGESLVRQILLGTRLFEQEFNAKCTYLWLPDVFGYSWALPQILKKSGISTFMTTKISWNQYNRMPHDTFMWRGLDGSEVLAHFITTPEPDGRKGWFYTYNGQLTAETIGGAWKAYRDKAINQNLLVSYGYGDGGGGVTRDMLEMRRRLDRMPCIPHVTTGRADEYFESLHETVSSTQGYVHTWDGELYLEYHRGTYTSQAYNKRMNRKLELAYREAEWLNAWVGGDRSRTAKSALTQGWKIILRNQFHDIIPGSSIHEVYEDSKEEYQEAKSLEQREWQAAVKQLVREQAHTFTVFNSASYTRTGIIHLSEADLAMTSTDGVKFTDLTGKQLVAQVVNDEWWVLVPQVPAMGAMEINVETTDTDHRPSPFTLAKGRFSTPIYALAWNESGQLTRIFDHRYQREVLVSGERGNVLQVFEDKPLAFDAWDIDIFYQEKMREVKELVNVEIIAEGDVCAVVRFVWTYGHSTVTQDLIAYAHSPRLDFVTHVDWHEHQQLLKVAFPVDIRATEATYDIQFGNVKRPTHWNTSWDMARFETVGHQWADVSEVGYGVALANDCKYGYDIKNSVLRLSLIKSAIHPDTEADQGDHEFTYSLLPHQGDWREGDVVKEAWDLNSPLRVEPGHLLLAHSSLFTVSSEHVHIDAAKIAENSDAMVVRFHEFAGGRQTMTVTCGLNVVRWCECNLLEQQESEWKTGMISLMVKPYEIKTLLIEVER